MSLNQVERVLLVSGLMLTLSSVSYAAGRSDAPSPDSRDTKAAIVNESSILDSTSPLSAVDQLDVVLSTVERVEIPSSSQKTPQTVRLEDVAQSRLGKAEAAEADTGAPSPEAVSEVGLLADEASPASPLPTFTTKSAELETIGKTITRAATPSAASKKLTGCRCALRTDEGGGGWGDCFSGCLSSWGVSPAMLVMCGASCGIGAVPVCAICVGVSVSVATLCAIGCDIYIT
jgi:hypothetical protein